MSDPDATAAANLRTAFDLAAAGERMMRQNLKRRHPEAGDEEIDRLLSQWMRTRPGAGVGRAVRWPRTTPPAT